MPLKIIGWFSIKIAQIYGRVLITITGRTKISAMSTMSACLRFQTIEYRISVLLPYYQFFQFSALSKLQHS